MACQRLIRTIFFTGGGSGGHVTPALAVIESVKARWPEISICYLGSRRGIERRIIPPLGISYHAIWTGKLRRTVTLRHGIDLLAFLIGILQSLFYLGMRRREGRVLLSTGGYVSLGPVIAARFLGYRVLIHEQTSRAGLANRLAGFFSHRIFLSFETSRSLFSLRKVVFSGYPLRRSIFTPPSGEILVEGVDLMASRKPLLLFAGGGNGSVLINEMVDKNLDRLRKNHRVVHQVGERFFPLYREKQGPDYVVFGFSPYLPDIVKQSACVITRAGAGMVSELIALGKAAIFIPLEIAQWKEQLHNAEEAVQFIPARILREKDLPGGDLLAEIEAVLKDKRRRSSRRRPNRAVEIIGDEIARLMQVK